MAPRFLAPTARRVVMPLNEMNSTGWKEARLQSQPCQGWDAQQVCDSTEEMCRTISMHSCKHLLSANVVNSCLLVPRKWWGLWQTREQRPEGDSNHGASTEGHIHVTTSHLGEKLHFHIFISHLPIFKCLLLLFKVLKSLWEKTNDL